MNGGTNVGNIFIAQKAITFERGSTQIESYLKTFIR